MHNTVYKLWLGLCLFGKSMDFPKLVYIWRGSCQNTPQLIYKHVVLHAKMPTRKQAHLLAPTLRLTFPKQKSCFFANALTEIETETVNLKTE